MDEDSHTDRGWRTRRRFLAGIGGATLLGAAGCMEESSGASGTPTRTPTTEETTTGETATDGPETTSRSTETDTAGTPYPASASPYTDVYRRTVDSVVLVRVYSTSGQGGQGSGFVWDDQHLVTNQHVVENSDELEVRFSQGDWREGEVVGADAYSDLAVVRVEDMPSYASPLELTDEDPPIGTRVVAIGNPFGFGGSMSQGIVSGVDRSLPGPNNFQIPDAIQTDAAVNPGNSGGPLVTLDGRVVGVVNSGGGDNLGFAISAALMERVVPALIEDGSYEHSYMGVRLIGVSPTIAEANDLEEVTGVLMVEIVKGGPSDGVLQGSPDQTFVNGQQVPVGGDVVVKMGDTPIPTQAALSTYLALNTSPGDTIPVEVIRDGERTTVDLTLGERPEA